MMYTKYPSSPPAPESKRPSNSPGPSALELAIRELESLRPNWVVSLGTRAGRPALSVLIYCRPVDKTVRPALDLRDIKRIGFPCSAGDGTLLMEPIQWVRREIELASELNTRDLIPGSRVEAES